MFFHSRITTQLIFCEIYFFFFCVLLSETIPGNCKRSVATLLVVLVLDRILSCYAKESEGSSLKMQELDVKLIVKYSSQQS